MTEPYSVEEIVRLHEKVITVSGGSPGIRDLGLLESALAQPFMTFDGEYIYTTMAERAASLGFSLIRNHPFVDGNKRIAHAAMDLFLRDSYSVKIEAGIDEQEAFILELAAGTRSREDLVDFLDRHIEPLPEAK